MVQAALNLSQSNRFVLPKKLKIDGKMGNQTISAIKTFQRQIVGFNTPDGRVDPKGKTISTIKQQLPKGLSEDALLAIMVKGNATTIKKYFSLFQVHFPQFLINTPLRKAHFLAQVGHESLSLIYTEELASGKAYEGRSDLGNTQKGDGQRFKGCGLIQLTGRSNYTSYGAYANLNLLQKGNEKWVSTIPSLALDVSLWFWLKRGLNNYADADNLRAITRRVNGGYNGLSDRQKYLDRAKFFLIP
jgi:putative chitinase